MNKLFFNIEMSRAEIKTTSIVTDNINCDDTLSTFNLYIAGNLRLSGVASSQPGQVCISAGSSFPIWSDPQYAARFYQNITQNMNGAAQVVLLNNATQDFTNIRITYSAGTFSLLEPGTYICRFQTIASTSEFQTQVNFRVNGVFAGSTRNIYIPSLTVGQPLVLEEMFRFGTTNNTIQVVSEPIVAGTVNTSGFDNHGIATTKITITRIGAFVT
jgi:hypothetical protein